MSSANTILTFVAAIGSGLVAGIWFAFSNFVMAGLSRTAPDKGIAAMQSINITVLNPVFFAALFGTALICLVLVTLCFVRWGEPGNTIILAAGLLYLIGCVGVTILGNVPLNDKLAAVEPGTSEAAVLWAAFLPGWLFWNHVRMVATLAAAIGFTVALV